MDDYIVLRDLASHQNPILTTWPTLPMDPSDYLLGSPSRGTPWSAGGASTYLFDTPPDPQVDLADIGGQDRLELQRDPEIIAIAPRMRMKLIRPLVVPSIEPVPDDWALQSIEALNTPWTGAGVKVAILDSGIDESHAAFNGLELSTMDFTGTGTGTGDSDGHGTHCAGILFGRDVDGRRIGVARGVTQAMVGKVLDDEGFGTTDSLFNGLIWAIQGGSNVISMSVGLDFPGEVRANMDEGWPAELATSRALEAYRANLRLFDSMMAMIRAGEAFGAGAVVVAASGNESRGDLGAEFRIAASLPAAAQGVISVGACEYGKDGLRVASFSNTMASITAPGVGIASAQTGGGIATLSGTSQACPHVAGVVALWWEALRHKLLNNPTLVRSNVLARARRDRFVDGTRSIDIGVGLVSSPPDAF